MLLSRPIARTSRLMTASARLSQLSAQLSSSAPASYSAPKKMTAKPSQGAAEPPVLFEAVHSLRKVTLNRPTKLNTITREMTDLLQPQMEVSPRRPSQAGQAVLVAGLPPLAPPRSTDCDLCALVQNFEASELAGVVLLKGAGRAFCAGGDVVGQSKHSGRRALSSFTCSREHD